LPSRIQTALHVYAFAALGVFLIAVPWSPVWDSATAPYLPTLAGSWLRSGFLRGLVSGLGGLNLVVACLEAREFLRPPGADPRA
jgi:hypothetical protein